MKTATLLHILMAVHTLIGAVSIFCLIYLPIAALKGPDLKKDKLLWLALIWPLANLVLMALNGMVCPLQNAAQVLAGPRTGWVRDIYWVPESWLAVVPWTFGPSYLIGAALVIWRLRTSSKPARPQRPASP